MLCRMTGNSLTAELEECRRQYDRIKGDARDLAEGLSDIHFNWRPAPAQWSIAQCLDHLTITAQQFLPRLDAATSKGREERLYSDGPFRYGWLETRFARWLEPPVRRKFRSPSRFAPPPDQPRDQVLQAFLLSHDQLLERLEDANGLHLTRLRVESPFSRWVRYSLGQSFVIIAAHDRRHLWQARQVRGLAQFPAPHSRRS